MHPIQTVSFANPNVAWWSYANKWPCRPTLFIIIMACRATAAAILLALPHFVVVYVRLPCCKHSKSTSMAAGCLDRQLATRQLINWGIYNTTGCKRDAATGQQPRQWRQTTHHRSLYVSFDHKNVRCSSIADHNSKMMPLLLTKSMLFTLIRAVQSPAYSDVCVNDK